MANNVEQLDVILRSLVGTGLTDMVGGHLPDSGPSDGDGGKAPADVVEH